MRHPKIIATMLATSLSLATMFVPQNSIQIDATTNTQVPKQTAIAVGAKTKKNTSRIKSLAVETKQRMDNLRRAKVLNTEGKWNVPLSQALQSYISKLCKQDGVDEKLAYSVMNVETGGTFNPNLISSTNDYGLMQINAINRGWLAKSLYITNWFDPFQNVKAGIYMLGQLTKKYHNVNEVLLAYHLGESGMLNTIHRGIWNTAYTLKALDFMGTLRLA